MFYDLGCHFIDVILWLLNDEMPESVYSVAHTYTDTFKVSTWYRTGVWISILSEVVCQDEMPQTVYSVAHTYTDTFKVSTCI